MGKGGYAIRSRRNSLHEGELKALVQVITVPTAEGASLTVPIVKGDFTSLPLACKVFIAEHVGMCKPRAVYICDGSQEEADELTEKLIQRGTLEKLDKMENCYR